MRVCRRASSFYVVSLGNIPFLGGGKLGIRNNTKSDKEMRLDRSLYSSSSSLTITTDLFLRRASSEERDLH
jgi:hypothetical protein